MKSQIQILILIKKFLLNPEIENDDRLNKMAPTENISSSSQRSSGPLYQRISNARYNALKAFNYNFW